MAGLTRGTDARNYVPVGRDWYKKGVTPSEWVVLNERRRLMPDAVSFGATSATTAPRAVGGQPDVPDPDAAVLPGARTQS